MPPRLGQDRSPRRRVTQELSSRQILEPFVYASPLNIRDAGEKYECDTVAELRPARKAIAIGFRWGDDLIAAAIRLCGAVLESKPLKCLSECQLRFSYLGADGTGPEPGGFS